MAAPASAVFYHSAAWRVLRLKCLERDGYHCAAPGCTAPATHADHIQRRPRVAHLTLADCLDNLRSLCARHDTAVKETPGGGRRNGGIFACVGADGWPIDPRRR